MANDGPIGRANVELGADTSKLEAGLSAAKEKTVASVVATEKAAAAAVPMDDSERYQAKLEQMAGLQALERRAQVEAADAADRAERASRDRAKSLANAAAIAAQASIAHAEAQTKQAESAEKAAAKNETFTASLKSMTNPARMAVGAINGIIGSFYSVIGLVGGVVGAFAAIGAALNAKARAAASANKELLQLNNTLLALQRTPLPGSFDPDAEASAIRRSMQDRIDAENTIYLAKIDAADKAGKKITGSTLEAERKARMVELQREADERLASLARYQDAMLNKRKGDELVAEQERVRMAKEAQEKIDQDRRESISQLMRDQAEAEDYYAQRDQARARAQQEQFAQLRSEINGLFNTSGLEVGINRVGQLIETLIQKVGDNR